MNNQTKQSAYQKYLKNEEMCPRNFKKMKRIKIIHYTMPVSYFSEVYKCTFYIKNQSYKEIELF